MKQTLIELSQRHIEKVRNRDRVLEKEQKDLEQRLDQIKTERNGFVEKLSRFESYEPSSQVCPICWIDNGTSINFKPIAGNEEFDKFKCSHCGASIDIQA